MDTSGIVNSGGLYVHAECQDMRIRILDTETCGVEAPDLQIVQIATVDLVSDSEDGAKGAEWTIENPRSWLVNPDRDIPVEAMGIHNTTDEMVEGAPFIDAILPLVFDAEQSEPYAYAAHNAAFDRKVLVANHGTGVDNMDGYPWACTYKGAVTVWPDAPSHKNNVLRYWLKLDLEQDLIPHSALGDAIITAHIAQRLLAEISLCDWLELSSRPVLLPRVHFGEHIKKPWSEVPQSYLSWIIHKSKGPWDPDVLHTAKHWYAIKDKQSRSRGPQFDERPYG